MPFPLKLITSFQNFTLNKKSQELEDVVEWNYFQCFFGTWPKACLTFFPGVAFSPMPNLQLSLSDDTWGVETWSCLKSNESSLWQPCNARLVDFAWLQDLFI